VTLLARIASATDLHVHLAQLRDDLFRLVALSRHSGPPVCLTKDIPRGPRGGPFQRGWIISSNAFNSAALDAVKTTGRPTAFRVSPPKPNPSTSPCHE
jgi:hypothetical protein